MTIRHTEVETGSHIHSPVIAIHHAALKKLDPEESPFRVCCPVCNQGIMLVTRNQNTFRLTRADRCTMCGQVFWYLDEKVGGEPFGEGPEMPNIDPGKCIFDGSQF
jgi:hypothetical protein